MLRLQDYLFSPTLAKIATQRSPSRLFAYEGRIISLEDLKPDC